MYSTLITKQGVKCHFIGMPPMPSVAIKNPEYGEIWEWNYDNPKNPDGTDKGNALLGYFKILEVVWEDTYSSVKIGRRDDGNIYIIEEREVSFHNSGSRTAVKRLMSLIECP